jgi:hypothetical protein
MDESPWEPPAVAWDRRVWDELYDSGPPPICTFCDADIDDRRYAVGLQILLAWQPNVVETRWAHVQCLRRAIASRPQAALAA